MEIKNKVDETISQTEGLIQMYQSGFLDGYIASKRQKKKVFYNKDKIWVEIKNICKENFEGRFMNRLKKNLKKHKKILNNVDELSKG